MASTDKELAGSSAIFHEAGEEGRGIPQAELAGSGSTAAIPQDQR